MTASNGMVRGMKEFFKDYKGCRNCKHQPEPLQMCDWRMQHANIDLICHGWEKRSKGDSYQ